MIEYLHLSQHLITEVTLSDRLSCDGFPLSHRIFSLLPSPPTLASMVNSCYVGPQATPGILSLKYHHLSNI